ncbi:hypothetical protein, partial [Burkholderia sp. Bp8990]|uniref:hypothetical protein n=1 Tax=Burkholderia sp. Bp8990 TaxID=2184552 RepID=UPI001C8A23E8
DAQKLLSDVEAIIPRLLGFANSVDDFIGDRQVASSSVALDGAVLGRPMRNAWNFANLFVRLESTSYDVIDAADVVSALAEFSSTADPAPL